MEDNIKPTKFCMTRKWQCTVPILLSLTSVIISSAALISAFVQTQHLNKELAKQLAAKRLNEPVGSISTQVSKTIPGLSPEDPGSTDTKRGPQTNSLQLSKTDLESLKSLLSFLNATNIDDINSTIDIERGSTYVHWGRSQCTGDAQLIYSGFGAGPPTVQKKLSGGGVQYLCLPEQPEWNRFDTSNDTDAYGWIYGARYMSRDTKIFDDGMHGQGVACSVCHSPRSAKVMIPALRNCPSSWTKEYEGYLMSSYVTNQRATFECVDVDAEPEGINGTDKSGALMYPIAGFCNGIGGLRHCPPYIHARELTCVMCTK